MTPKKASVRGGSNRKHGIAIPITVYCSATLIMFLWAVLDSSFEDFLNITIWAAAYWFAGISREGMGEAYVDSLFSLSLTWRLVSLIGGIVTVSLSTGLIFIRLARRRAEMNYRASISLIACYISPLVLLMVYDPLKWSVLEMQSKKVVARIDGSIKKLDNHWPPPQDVAGIGKVIYSINKSEREAILFDSPQYPFELDLGIWLLQRSDPSRTVIELSSSHLCLVYFPDGVDGEVYSKSDLDGEVRYWKDLNDKWLLVEFYSDARSARGPKNTEQR